MLHNYLTTFFRIMKRQMVYSAIHVFGLAVGIAATLLIALYITDELSYDRFHNDAERIYRIGIFVRLSGVDNPYAVSGFGTAETLSKETPGIESLLRIMNRPSTLLHFGDKSLMMEKLIYSDSNFFDFFDFKLLVGDPKNVLSGPNKIVLTESSAQNIFGLDQGKNYNDIIGKIVLVGYYKAAMEVTGIAADPPPNSHFKFDSIISSETDIRTKSLNHWTPDCYSYIKLSRENSIDQVEAALPLFVKKYYEQELGATVSFEDVKKRGDEVNYHFMPLLNIHLDSHQLSELEVNGNRSYLYLLSIIGAFVLVLVCINFINLSTARATSRAKEVGIRKTIGALTNKLRHQFIFESFMYTLSGFVLGLALVSVFIGPFNLLTEKNLLVIKLLETDFLMGIVIMLIFITILSGSYPAFILSSFRPAEVLKGKLSSRYKGNEIRNSMVVFQFVISTTLIISSLMIYKQLQLLQTKNLGFDLENILCLTNTLSLQDNYESFKNELIGSSDIVSASYSNKIISEPIKGNGGRRKKGTEDWHTVFAFGVDEDFGRTIGLKMVSGRFFSKDFPSDDGAIIINRAAAEAMGIADLKQEEFLEYIGNNGLVSEKIIGIVENFNFESLKSAIHPLIIYRGGSSRMSIRLTPGDLQQKVKAIENVWKKYSSTSFEYSMLDENLNAQYKSEKNLGKITLVFTSLSIIIASFGLLGLVTYMASQRTKEIGIRKVMGASAQQIVVLLSKDFLKLVIVAFVIAVPISWYGLNEWLQTFAYHIDFSFTVAAFSGFSVMLIALLTLSYQSIHAAMSNPVKSLRAE